MSYTQWHKSNGEVMLSKWWRTPSARAAFNRVKSENRKRFKALKAAKAAEAKQPWRKVTRRVTRKTKRGGKR